LGVEDGEAFDVGAAAGEEVAASSIPIVGARGFRSFGAFGVADMEIWEDENEAGDLEKDLGWEREERGEVRRIWVARFCVAVSGLKNEIEDGEAGIYSGEAEVEAS